MPIVAPALTLTITPNLLATGMVGIATPQFAAGLAAGVCLWVPTIRVTTMDTGSVGVGLGVGPLVVPQPLLYTNLLTAYASCGLLGIMAPLKILGMSTGLSLGFAQGILQTIHPGIGSGAGVAKLLAPLPTPMLLSGFASVGMTGTDLPRIATAIGIGLMQTFNLLLLPVVITGSGSPVAGVSTGSGSVI